jgi:phenylalanyl-tRNA synthetase alpha chain
MTNWNKEIEDLRQIINQFEVKDASSLEAFRIAFLGTKGKLKDVMQLMKEVPNEEKKIFGQAVNELKSFTESLFENYKTNLGTSSNPKSLNIDFWATATKQNFGVRHPISLVRNEIIQIFSKIGFVVAEGPEIEDDWHNFTALNTPKDHPARDMQDTFFLTEDKEFLLRTHTSSAQIRAMEHQNLPLRILTPGRVFRNETISARAHCTFHQVEGLYIDEGVSFADLKQCIYYFAKEMFGSENVRFRPSFFPFTEPSAEIDISCFICNQKGCNVCKKSGWVEIGGSGMVDPNVLKNCKLDSNKYSGFAFGMGIERIAMLKYQINDIRLFWQNDIRFLNQFKAAF